MELSFSKDILIQTIRLKQVFSVSGLDQCVSNCAPVYRNNFTVHRNSDEW